MHLSHCDHALYVVRLSVVDTFSHFRLFLWNRWTEFNKTWQEARLQDCVLDRSEKTRWSDWPLIGWNIFDFSYETAQSNSTLTKLDSKQGLKILCGFRVNRKNKVATLASDCLKYLRLPLGNRWMEFHETCQEARSKHPLQSFCIKGQSEKTRWPPGLWLADTFYTSSLKPLHGMQQNLTGGKISTSSTKFVFWADRKKQDGRPGLWLADTFWHPFCNHRREFNET